MMSILRQIQLFGASWRFDLASMLVGLLLGIALALVIHRAWPGLNRWWQQGTNRLRQSFAWMRSGVETRFRSETREYAKRHHLGREWSDLDQVFVPPRLLIPAREVDLSFTPDWGARQLNHLWPDLAARVATPLPPSIGMRELLLQGGRTVVSGGGGNGKTTLLAYCAYQCAAASADGPYAELHAVVPVFVHLAELALSDLVERRTEDPAKPLVSALQRRCSPLTSPGISGMLGEKLQSGQLLLLLDGWDELPVEERPQATAWLGNLLNRFPDIRVVVAAPLRGYGPLLELDFTVTTLLPWRGGQAEAFAESWSNVFSPSQVLGPGSYWRPGQPAIETSLRLWLQAANTGKLKRPNNWTELFQRSVSLFSGNSNGKAKGESGDEASEPEAITLAFWQRLAAALLMEGKLSLEQAEVRSFLEEVLDEAGNAERGTSDRLQRSLEESNLFIRWSNGTVGFMCVGWRDFLAANYLAQQGASEAIAAYATDPDWADVIGNFVGLAGAKTLATTMTSSPEQEPDSERLFRVAGWMARAKDNGEWRRQTMVQLGQIVRQPKFAVVLRSRAAVALVQTGEPGILTFATQLKEQSDPFFRQLAAMTFSHLGTKQAVEALTDMLGDADSPVRQAAVWALARLPHKLVERPLLIALVQGDDEMSRIAAEALAQNGGDGIDILREAVEDEDVQVRRAAILALAHLDDAWLDPLLARIEQKDDEWLVRSAATAARELIAARKRPPPWQPVPMSQQKWLVQHATEDGHISTEQAGSQAYLLQLLAESESPQLRAAAAIGLGNLSAYEAVSALKTATSDSDRLVSEAAFSALCQIHRAYDGIDEA